MNHHTNKKVDQIDLGFGPSPSELICPFYEVRVLPRELRATRALTLVRLHYSVHLFTSTTFISFVIMLLVLLFFFCKKKI